MERIISIPILNSYDITNLEKLQYEVDARKSLLTFILNQYNENTSSMFKIYHNEYVKIFADYEKEKQNFEINFVKSQYPNAIKWALNFNDQIVDITVEE